MLLSHTKRAGTWARRMRSLLLPEDGTKALVCVGPTREKSSGRLWARINSDSSDSESDLDSRPKLGPSYLPAGMPLASFYRNMHNQDLRRFLEEVGTNPKEARYWLKHFQRASNSQHPFAVIHIDSHVFDNPNMLDDLGSAIAFLQRNSMKCVILHGDASSARLPANSQELKEIREELTEQSCRLASFLEAHGVAARPLFPGCGIFQAVHQKNSAGEEGFLLDVNKEPIIWALHSNHVAILQNVVETESGQLVMVDACSIMMKAASALEPLKVLWLNTTGGFVDDNGDVVANVSMPVDWEAMAKKPWCTARVQQKIEEVSKMLETLPSHSSVVITSASNMLNELFTHHGCGTFFKEIEPVNVYSSLDQIDKKRLFALLNKSFGRELKPDYFEGVEDRIHSIYLSEGYNAAAIITYEEGTDIPYLDKFAVSLAKQGEGVADVLWKHIKHDYQQLFWRSRDTNVINPWYFKHSEGSWCHRNWIVFWYGISSHSQSSVVVDIALNKEASFL